MSLGPDEALTFAGFGRSSATKCRGNLARRFIPVSRFGDRFCAIATPRAVALPRKTLYSVDVILLQRRLLLLLLLLLLLSP